jgi:two-component system sensor histidine kinase ArlS
MKIKQRIVLLFTGLVTAILLFLCISIYFFSDRYRQNDFRKRLRNRAITTMSLLSKVPEINKNLLKRIDELTLVALQQRSVMVYDDNGNLIYHYVDENANPVLLNDQIKAIVKKTGEYYYSGNSKDIVALSFKDSVNNYIIVSAAYDRDGVQTNKELKLILIISFFAGVLITFVSGVFFSNKLVGPIKRITNEVKEISSRNLSRRIPASKHNDELNELAATFNELMTRLQESFEIQRRFIANASHELSTPLTSILSQLEITLQKERSFAEYKEVIQSVYEDVIDMTQLAKSLLEIAKASGSFAGIELASVRVDELLMKLPYTLKKEDTKNQVVLHFDVFPEDEDKLLLFGNADLLFIAIKNIVQNACKYSTDHIANVSLHFTNEQVQIVISDNGPGIKDVDIPFIFQPFYRGSNSGTNEGFGLGLSMAHKIINMHKGSIILENKMSGGSVFTLQLPVAGSFQSV